MPILQFLENATKGVAQLPIQTSENFSNTFANLGNRLAGRPNQTIQQNMGGNSFLNKTLQFSGATGKNVQLGTDIGQVGLSVAAPAIGDAAAGALGATSAITKGALGGASVGGAFNTLNAVGQGDTKGSDLAMNFLAGTAAGAALGGTAAGIGSVAKTLFTDKKLTNMAKNENVSQIEKDLTPVTGPVSAQQIAPAIASANDKEVVARIVDNEIKTKLPSPTPAQAAEIPPTSVSEPAPPVQGSEQTTNMEIPGSPAGPTTGGKLEAIQNLRDSVISGEDVSTAMQRYADATGTTMGAAQLQLKDLMGKGGIDKSTINAQLNPEIDKIKVNPVAQGDTEGAVRNSRMVRNAVTRAGNVALQEADKLSRSDISLLDQLRTTTPDKLLDQAENPEQFQRAADAIKKYNDTTHALGAGQLGQDVPYRQNYGAPLLFQQEEGGVNQAIAKMQRTPGYGKQRFFSNYDEAAQFGLQRKNENILGDIYEDVGRRQNTLAQLSLAKGLQEAYPDQIKEINSGENIPTGYTQLQIPGGKKLFAPNSLAQEINSRAPVPQAKGALAGYDAINSEFKNLKLAAGGFHSINVLGSYLGQQIASGKLFSGQGVSDLGKVISSTFSKDAYQSELSRMNREGTLINADAAGLKYSTGEIHADIGEGGKISGLPGLKQIHDGIFNRQIPLLKLKIFEQQTQGLDRNVPEDLQKMNDIAKGLNNAFGGINREIQGLTPAQFSRFQRIFLATDYNEGQLRTLGNAFNPGANATERKLAQQIVFGKALLFGGLATAGGVASGEFQDKTPQQAAFDIIHKMVDPSFQVGGYKVGFPTTQIAEVSKPIEQTVSGAKAGKGYLQGAQNFATNRLAALPSEALQLGNNKNYLGQPLYGTDTRGRPISAGDTTLNVGSGFLPIPAAQAAQTATGNQSVAAAVANTAGLRVTPTNTTDSLPVEQQTYISSLQNTLKKSGMDPNQQKAAINAVINFDSIIRQNATARKKADDQINRDIASGNVAKAKQDASAFNQKLFQALQKAIKPEDTQFLQLPVTGADGRPLKNPYQYLTGNTYGYFTNLNLSERNTTIRNNPTKYGLKIGG